MGFFDSIFKKNKSKSVNKVNTELNNIEPREEQIIIKPIEEKQIIIKQKEIAFRVAGITYNGIQQNIKSMVKEEKEDLYEGLSNKEILEEYSEDDKIYEIDICGNNELELIPEPKNKFDSNAIKVVHKEIGNVGYVPTVDCEKVKKALENGYYIAWKLIGGKYKYIESDFEKDKEVVKISNNTYGIMITLTEPN